MSVYVIRCFLPQRKALRCITTFHCIPHTPTLIRHSGLQPRASISTDPTVSSSRRRWYGVREKLLKLWKPLPVSVGLVILAVLQWRHIQRRRPTSDETSVVAKNWEITCYKAVPLRALSRMWGWLTNKELPIFMRSWLYSYYASTFGCNLEEAAHQDLKMYRSLAEFFCRPLRDGVRPVDQDDCIVSPADGRVLSFGCVDTCKVEQVKGVTYSLQAFLGQPTWTSKLSPTKTKLTPEPDYKQSLLLNQDTALYQCVVYLAPGDYHRFHSPVQWDVMFRRHFQGELLSVNPRVAQWIPDLFALNERAVYVGQWKHGFFSLTAVGATNVGSIHVYCDKDLITNQRKWRKMNVRQKDADIERVQMYKGEPFGEFRLGSTIVLLFEAPRNYKFKLTREQHIRVGQGISECNAG